MIAVTATATPHTCAMRSDRQVFCWGYNEQGQCGAGFTSVNLGASINDLGNNFKAFNLGTGEFPHRADPLHATARYCREVSVEGLFKAITFGWRELVDDSMKK
jgi:hypothetical protein